MSLRDTSRFRLPSQTESVEDGSNYKQLGTLRISYQHNESEYREGRPLKQGVRTAPRQLPRRTPLHEQELCMRSELSNRKIDRDEI